MRFKTLLSILVFGVIGHSVCFADPAPKVVGRVGMIEGEVWVDSVQVLSGSTVKEGSVIELKSDSRATLILGKGSVFHLASNTKMVIHEYGVKAEGQTETADLDLKFGKTRALILNQGPKREIRIRSRATTMGVRGTEIFIDSPQESSKPLQFFTIEGSAEVKTGEGIAPVILNQNQGLATSVQSRTEGAVSLKTAEVKDAIQKGGLAPMKNGGEAVTQALSPSAANRGNFGHLSDQLGIGALPPVLLDPIQDRPFLPSLQPRFCNATTGGCF
jgi:hypothetical protein